MDNTADSGYLDTGVHVSSFGYAIGISLGILFLFTTITLASYFCARSNNQIMALRAGQSSSSTSTDINNTTTVIEIGIDEETLLNYPKVLFSQAAAKVNAVDVVKMDSTAATCCSVCLADYSSSDLLRLLPECGHFFHLKCVDPWLRLHPTCPMCRTSPLPTPHSTPLAAVAPLATRPPI